MDFGIFDVFGAVLDLDAVAVLLGLLSHELVEVVRQLSQSRLHMAGMAQRFALAPVWSTGSFGARDAALSQLFLVPPAGLQDFAGSVC